MTTPAPGPRPILTAERSRAADAAAVAAGTRLAELMERAGAAVADAAAARWTPRPTVVLCGPGDNGGDGFVAARLLRGRGWSVTVAALEGAHRSPAAAQAAERWGGEVAPLSPGVVDGAGLVVDAVFGAGLSRPIPAAAQGALSRAAGAGVPILAVDLPSGLEADTGRPLGEVAAAVVTVSFQLRPAHLLVPGRELCSEVVVADIGAPPRPQDVDLWETTPALWAPRYPWPKPNTHKVERGRLVVVGGDASHTGAARMSARAGLRIGAGLVTLLSPPDALPINAAALEAVMVRAFGDAAELGALSAKAQAAVIGPAAGVTPATAANVRALAAAGAALVVDADALTVFRDDPDALFALLDDRDVLTPHPGEFERVFPGVLYASPERITAARRAAERAGCVVLLKGGDTVVAAPDGRAAMSGITAPWLATAGSGDVLAGLIGGLLAQGMASFEAACAAVWIHAEAGRRHGPGLIAEDLPDLVPAILNRLWKERP